MKINNIKIMCVLGGTDMVTNKKGISLIKVIATIIVVELIVATIVISIFSIKYMNNKKIAENESYMGLTITKDTEGVIFTKADGVTPGDVDNIESGDIVLYGDYEYRYNSSFENDINTDKYEWFIDSRMNGWRS